MPSFVQYHVLTDCVRTRSTGITDSLKPRQNGHHLTNDILMHCHACNICILTLYWNLFLRVHLAIIQYSFSWLLRAEQATSNHMFPDAYMPHSPTRIVMQENLQLYIPNQNVWPNSLHILVISKMRFAWPCESSRGFKMQSEDLLPQEVKSNQCSLYHSCKICSSSQIPTDALTYVFHCVPLVNGM